MTGGRSPTLPQKIPSYRGGPTFFNRGHCVLDRKLTTPDFPGFSCEPSTRARFSPSVLAVLMKQEEVHTHPTLLLIGSGSPRNSNDSFISPSYPVNSASTGWSPSVSRRGLADCVSADFKRSNQHVARNGVQTERNKRKVAGK